MDAQNSFLTCMFVYVHRTFRIHGSTNWLDLGPVETALGGRWPSRQLVLVHYR